jgi:DNA-binding transcriptional LysR family regulator
VQPWQGWFRLTEKGELLLQASRGLLLQIEQFRQQANGVAGRLLGSVRIGLAENQDSSVTLRIAQPSRVFASVTRRCSWN